MNKIMYMFQNFYYQLLRLIPPTSGRMLNNKWVLYFIFVVGLFDLINFYKMGNLVAVAVFVVVGFLTSFFSKNMIVILVMAIAVTHLVTYGNREGLKNGDGAADDDDDVDEGFEEEEVDEGFEEEDVDEGFEEGVDEEDDEERPKEEMMTTKNDNQTSELLKKQNELMVKMNQLQPLLDKAENLFKTQKTDGFQNMNKNTFAEYK